MYYIYIYIHYMSFLVIIQGSKTGKQKATADHSHIYIRLLAHCTPFLLVDLRLSTEHG